MFSTYKYYKEQLRYSITRNLSSAHGARASLLCSNHTAIVYCTIEISQRQSLPCLIYRIRPLCQHCVQTDLRCCKRIAQATRTRQGGFAKVACPRKCLALSPRIHTLTACIRCSSIVDICCHCLAIYIASYAACPCSNRVRLLIALALLIRSCRLECAPLPRL